MTSLLHQPWVQAPETRAVLAALEAVRPNGSRFVGGCVRNALLGRTVEDIDIATQITPEEVMRAGENAGLGVHPTGLAHGTVTLVSRGRIFEVTTLRRDVETDGRHAKVAFTEDWTADAQRRDFHLNALYADGEGALYDPTGKGLDDVKHARVRFIGDAAARIREDHLRILRFFRFSAWYVRGDLDSAGLAACAAARDQLQALSMERVWKEWKKLLQADDPSAALRAMQKSGVFEVVAPELADLERGLRLIALETDAFLPPDALRRTAAMAVDPQHAEAFARRMKSAVSERERLAAALGQEPKIVSYLSMRALRRALYALDVQTFEDRAFLAWAQDANPRTTAQWRGLMALAQGWTRPNFPLTGADVVKAGVAPGPAVGAILREVEAWWVDADFPDDKLALVERLKAVAQAIG